MYNSCVKPSLFFFNLIVPHYHGVQKSPKRKRGSHREPLKFIFTVFCVPEGKRRETDTPRDFNLYFNLLLKSLALKNI